MLWVKNVKSTFFLCFLSLYFVYSMYIAFLQFVVGLGDKVSPTDIEEGMRVG